MKFGSENLPIFCDVAGDTLRPYIPKTLRRAVFDLFHAPSHPSAKIMDRIIRKRYVWPNMHRDISIWCRGCVDCQQSKISRHVKFAPAQIVPPDARFQHVHVDIVGPLPLSEGYQYCLTMIDRYSRWPEAVPILNIEAATVARAIYDTWVARFGAPTRVSSDRGSQFESQLFDAFRKLIGTYRIRTTAYHPKSNGMVERIHRPLKAAIMCHNVGWTRSLSTVLLGLRTSIRLDTDACPADFVYGSTLRLPGEFFISDEFQTEPLVFLEEFRENLRDIRPVPVTHNNSKKVFFFDDLKTCSQVWYLDKTKKSLDRPYIGPFKVLDRISDRVYRIEKKGTVSVELLKPAYRIPTEVVDDVLRDHDDRNDFFQAPSAHPMRRTSPRMKKFTFSDSVKK